MNGATKKRKSPITYGKSSRRRISDFSSPYAFFDSDEEEDRQRSQIKAPRLSLSKPSKMIVSDSTTNDASLFDIESSDDGEEVGKPITKTVERKIKPLPSTSQHKVRNSQVTSKTIKTIGTAKTTSGAATETQKTSSTAVGAIGKSTKTTKETATLSRTTLQRSKSAVGEADNSTKNPPAVKRSASTINKSAIETVSPQQLENAQGRLKSARKLGTRVSKSNVTKQDERAENEPVASLRKTSTVQKPMASNSRNRELSPPPPGRTRVTRSMSAQPEPPPMETRPASRIATSRAVNSAKTGQGKDVGKVKASNSEKKNKTAAPPYSAAVKEESSAPKKKAATAARPARLISSRSMPISPRKVAINASKFKSSASKGRARSSSPAGDYLDGDVEMSDAREHQYDAEKAVENNALFEFSILDDVATSTPKKRKLIDRLMPDQTPRMSAVTRGIADVSFDESFNVESASRSGWTSSQTVQQQQILETPKPALSREPSGMDSGGPVFRQRDAHKITYTSHRSYRLEEPAEDALLADAPPLPSVLRQIVASQSQDLDESDDEEDLGATGPSLKSIHELREAGENKRFNDEVDGYFEDMEEGHSLGQKRTGYMELASKMQSKEFVNKFRTNNYDNRLLETIGSEDVIICFATCFISWTVLENDTSGRFAKQMYRAGVIDMLSRVLEEERDIMAIAKDRKTNMSKAGQGLVSDMRAKVLGSSIFSGAPVSVVSPGLIGLCALDVLIQRLRRLGVSEDVLSPKTIRKVYGAIRQAVMKLSKMADPSQSAFLRAGISMLESYTTSRAVSVGEALESEDLAHVANILSKVDSIQFDDKESLRLLVLRLDINLTAGRLDICKAMSHSDIFPTLLHLISSGFKTIDSAQSEENRTSALDTLILSLGLLINFAELSAHAREKITANHPSEFTDLLKIFLERWTRAQEASSMEETESAVAFGYLSILLGNFCRSPSSREEIRKNLPGGKLETLARAVNEFIAVNCAVDRMQGIELEEGLSEGFVQKMQEVASLLND